MLNKRVFVAMSGGVDSSFTAGLLQQQGYDCVGITLLLHDNGVAAKEQKCVLDSKKVAQQLNIEHRVLDLRKEFQEYVVEYFINTYKNGRTPNPCIICNKKIKFGELLCYAQKNGADFLATGHYARISRDDTGKAILTKACDETKDQSYFLYQLNSSALEKILMPLGEYTKVQVRELSGKMNLAVAEKKDSQEICFIPDNDYKGFLCKNNLQNSSGAVKDINGKVIGSHNGIHLYTVGQRRGLPVNVGKPLFVKEINSSTNEIILAEAYSIFSEAMIVRKLTWAYDGIEDKHNNIEVKIRYKAKPVECKLIKKEGENAVIVVFAEPQKAVTPGQFAVFYKNNSVLGGGVIDRAKDL